MTNPFATPCRVQKDYPFTQWRVVDAEGDHISRLFNDKVGADALCLYINEHDKLVEIIRDFVEKVESGRARSKDTYGKCCAVLAEIEKGV